MNGKVTASGEWWWADGAGQMFKFILYEMTALSATQGFDQISVLVSKAKGIKSSILFEKLFILNLTRINNIIYIYQSDIIIQILTPWGT